MPTSRSSESTSSASHRSTTHSTSSSASRDEVLDMLKKDHRNVKKAYKEFTKLDPLEDTERCDAIVRQVLADLQVHTTLEEEFLYPAAREAEPKLIDEAEVEHESAKALIEQLDQMEVGDEKFSARFTVLCEYVEHHIKEEEKELFPKLEKLRLDWATLSEQMLARREQLEPPPDAMEDGAPDSGGTRKGSSSQRPA